MTKDSSVTYVEMDMPDAARQKYVVVEELKKQITIDDRPNLHVEGGSALVSEDTMYAARHFRKSPVTVINEGLLRYFNQKEKGVFAMNIYRLLEEYGGAWITPDVCARGMNATGPLKAIVREQNERLRTMTGIDVRKNYFPNEDAARAFFEKMGFAVERHPFTEVTDSLVSPLRENLSSDQVADSIGSSAAYVMKVAS